jgi:hypothetical protein
MLNKNTVCRNVLERNIFNYGNSDNGILIFLNNSVKEFFWAGRSAKISPAIRVTCTKTPKRTGNNGEDQNRSVWGFFIATAQPSVPGTRQVLVYFTVPRPPALPVAKVLPAACPGQNTHGAGVVMPADEQIGAAEKNPQALLHRQR